MHLVCDINLLDFCEKKLDKTILHTSQDVLEMSMNYEDNHPNNYCSPFSWRGSKLLGGISQWFEEEYPQIYNILLIGRGCVSVCGENVLFSTLGDDADYFDLYIHSCTTERANIIIEKSINSISNAQYHLGKNYLEMKLDTFTIRLHLDIYDDRAQILRYNYSIIDKHIWDPINGYACTKAAAMLLIKNIIRLLDCERDQTQKTIKQGNLTPTYAFDDISRDYTYNEYFYEIMGDIICSYRISRFDIDETIEWSNTSPINIPIKLFLKQDQKRKVPNYRSHERIIIGIDDDRFIALSGIRRKYNIDNDTFKIICEYLLIEEAKLAQEKLLGDS